ncbi:MAG: 4Fe-4S dicluster domain-containing protein [Erysipelotrichaceae bacterium]|nr:4Fe-4S dicluster domain-containing protein [Erysipelotrichaceae bacterium]
MKIALLSFHNAYNYGAALQAYGLQCAVERLGFDCEYINYVNEYRRNSYDMSFQLREALKNRKWIRAAKVCAGTPIIKKRAKAFKLFYSKYLRMTDKEYTSSQEARLLNNEYNRFIVGSDQVWNPENNGGDMAFLLDFVDDSAKKISYSSSFGISEIPEDYLQKYKGLLSDFSYLAVRERQGVNLVKQLTGIDAQLVLDPVFLAGRSTWDSLRKQQCCDTGKKYAFFYTNRPTQIEDFLMTGYNMKGLEKHVLSSHVTPLDFINPKTKICASMSPIQFLNEIADAELVVTASFHCLAFAIIFHKKFSVLLTGDYGKDERILSLLKILGLEDRIVDINTSAEDINREIDYDDVENRLKNYYDNSLDYLNKSLNNETYTVKKFDDMDSHYFCEDSRCTGCTACVHVCPTGAISMVRDKEGFEVPFRDSVKCIDCGKCAIACQVLNKTVNNTVNQRFYAIKNTDEVRKSSSSGGCFKSISDSILKLDGIICAASINKEFKVEHIFARNAKQLENMRGTYYVQSHLGDSFKKISDFLKQGKKVLFVGTPCQVSGLIHTVGAHDNLYTCDLICHGVPSPQTFEAFIDYLRGKGDLKSFKFRDKEMGYKGYTVSATFGNKRIGKKLWLNSYNNMFSHNMINRLSCSSCKYSNYNRPGDITIGDFWGIEKKYPKIADNKGVSLMIVNSVKGQRIVDSIKDWKLFEVRKEDTGQKSLMKPSIASSYRYQVMRNVILGSYDKAARKYGENNLKGLIKELIRRTFKI